MVGLSGAPRQSTAPFTMLPRSVTHQESSRIIGKLCCSSGVRSHNNRGVPVRRRSSKAGHEGAQDTHTYPEAQLPSCSHLLSRLRNPCSALLQPPQLGNFLKAFPSQPRDERILIQRWKCWFAKHLEEVHGTAWASRQRTPSPLPSRGP